MRKSSEKVCRRIKVKWQRERVIEMESLGQGFKRKSTNMGSYKIPNEQMMGLFDLMLYVESLQFNDPRYTDDRFHVFSVVSIKIFSLFFY